MATVSIMANLADHSNVAISTRANDDVHHVQVRRKRQECWQENSREQPIIIEDDESGSVSLRSRKRQTNSRGDSRENAIIIDEDELSPDKTAARPRKRRRTGERERKAETPLEDCDAVATAENSLLPLVRLSSNGATAAPRTSQPRTRRLTFQQLSAYDDILTDTLLDRVYYSSTIRKFSTSYQSTCEDQQSVVSILRDVVIGEKDLPKAERLLLALPGLKAFSNHLGSAKEHAAFQQHMTRYLKLYLPDCPFEISSTNRYTGTTFEATIISRRNIWEGEEIKYLCGTRAILTQEEEEDLDDRGKNFSIITTTRNQATSLLAGPGRFANHDCKANARLTTPGVSGVQIFAVRNIGIGEEITVAYDDNFFGDRNCECLCKTCEDSCQNGWVQSPDESSGSAPSLKRVPGDYLKSDCRIGIESRERAQAKRHKKLYGYHWPKTKPKDRYDVEERAYSPAL